MSSAANESWDVPTLSAEKVYLSTKITCTSGDLITLWGEIQNDIHPEPSFSDEVVWTSEEHGNFTLKSAYAMVLNLSSQDAIPWGDCVV